MRRVFPLIAFVLPSVAAAQPSPVNCEIALAKDIGQLHTRDVTSLALMETVRRKSGSTTNWASALTVPIDGVPVGGDNSASQTKTKEYFQQSSTNWNSDRLVSVATQTLPRDAVEAYKACLSAPPPFGPRLYVYDATPTAATILIKWYAPPGAPPRQRLDVVKQGFTFNVSFPDSLSTNTEVATIVTRDSASDLRLVVNIGGQQANEFIAYLPPAPPVVAPPAVKTRIIIPARSFVRPQRVALGGPKGRYGADVLLNADYNNPRPANAAEFEFTATAAGTYMLQVEYAAALARPVHLIVNGKMAVANALNAPTGCWETRCQRLLNQGQVTLVQGLNVLRLESSTPFPHVRSIVLEPVP